MTDDKSKATHEEHRLLETKNGNAAWKQWGPYLSERAWGTVREDYSAGGDAWNYFPHDHARSRVYRWNEDGLGGFSDNEQHLCFALALWNGRDAILKERLYGLTNSEGNHGEDAGVQQLEFEVVPAPLPVHPYQRFVGKGGLGILVQHPVVRMGRSGINVEVVFLHIFAVIALRVGQAEETLLENRIPVIPQAEREAEIDAVITESGNTIFAPAIHPRTSLLVAERVPGISIGTLIFSDRAPLALAEIRTPLPPADAVVGLLEPIVLPMLRRHTVTIPFS